MPVLKAIGDIFTMKLRQFHHLRASAGITGQVEISTPVAIKPTWPVHRRHHLAPCQGYTPVNSRQDPQVVRDVWHRASQRPVEVGTP